MFWLVGNKTSVTAIKLLKIELVLTKFAVDSCQIIKTRRYFGEICCWQLPNQWK